MVEQRYEPWGVVRWQDGTLPTDFAFTGQRAEAFGLLDYNARYYSPRLQRFISADSIVPNPGDPQSLNRYSYAGNNPVLYRDPSGHAECVDAECRRVVHPITRNVIQRRPAPRTPSTIYDRRTPPIPTPRATPTLPPGPAASQATGRPGATPTPGGATPTPPSGPATPGSPEPPVSLLPSPYPSATPTPVVYWLGERTYFDPSKVDWTAFWLDLGGIIGDVGVVVAPGPIAVASGVFSTLTDVGSVVHACRKAGIYGWDDFKTEMIGQGVKKAEKELLKRQVLAGIPAVGAFFDLYNLVENVKQGFVYID